MPKPRKYEPILCQHFAWRLATRSGVWQADGRSNTPNAGRHSLGTKDKKEALTMLSQLDQRRAEDLGLAPRSAVIEPVLPSLPLQEGRSLYEEYIARPRVTGGVKKSTVKKYRSAFDKFLPFAKSRGVTDWQGVTAKLLNDYAAHLEKRTYAQNTILKELVTIKQAFKWLIDGGHLAGMEPIKLKLRKAESERAYCWKPEEVEAMLEHCQVASELDWLGNVITALACTGMRISELAGLRWSDINLETERLTLTDETGKPCQGTQTRRQLKSGRSRSFPMHHDLVAVLKRLPHRGAHIFRGPRGGFLKPDTVRRILVRDVLEPLSEKFPTNDGVKGFRDGRLHSFRHYFCSTCASSGVPERIVMDWLGHQDSEMIRVYFHLHNSESCRKMNELDFLGNKGGRSADAS